MPADVRIATSEFVASASDVTGAPRVELPEICFVGRSNVGKSSALNALLGRRKLARVSRTPGRTRPLNFFTATFLADGARVPVSLCDLPGYGYAKASKAELARWRPMIERYLERRERLCGVVMLVDARHEPSPLDRDMVGWISGRRPLLVVATKSDKLSKHRLFGALRAIERGLGLPAESALALSSETGAGFDELRERLLEISRAPGDPTGT